MRGEEGRDETERERTGRERERKRKRESECVCVCVLKMGRSTEQQSGGRRGRTEKREIGSVAGKKGGRSKSGTTVLRPSPALPSFLRLSARTILLLFLSPMTSSESQHIAARRRNGGAPRRRPRHTCFRAQNRRRAARRPPGPRNCPRGGPGGTKSKRKAELPLRAAMANASAPGWAPQETARASLASSRRRRRSPRRGTHRPPCAPSTRALEPLVPLDARAGIDLPALAVKVRRAKAGALG